MPVSWAMCFRSAFVRLAALASGSNCCRIRRAMFVNSSPVKLPSRLKPESTLLSATASPKSFPAKFSNRYEIFPLASAVSPQLSEFHGESAAVPFNGARLSS